MHILLYSFHIFKIIFYYFLVFFLVLTVFFVLFYGGQFNGLQWAFVAFLVT